MIISITTLVISTIVIISFQEIDLRNLKPSRSASLSENSEQLLGFLNNFENIISIDLLSLNDSKFPKARFFLNHIKKKCLKLITADQKETTKDKIKLKLLLLERGFDLNSPAFLDLHYEPLLSEVLHVDLAKPVISKTSKVYYNESSELYKQYRYAFFNEIMEKIPNELKQFKQKYKMLIGDEGELRDLDSNKINEAVRNVNDHNREKQELTLHLKNVKALDKWMTDYDILGRELIDRHVWKVAEDSFWN